MKRILFAWLCLLSFISCSQPKALVYRDVRNFRIHKADLQQVTMVMDLCFYNPNHYSVSLKDGDMDAYFNGHLFGKALLDEQTPIPAQDTFLLPVTVTANISNVFSNALELLSNPEITVRLEGSVKAGKGGIFIKIPVHYEGRQRISL